MMISLGVFVSAPLGAGAALAGALVSVTLIVATFTPRLSS